METVSVRRQGRPVGGGSGRRREGLSAVPAERGGPLIPRSASRAESLGRGGRGRGIRSRRRVCRGRGGSELNARWIRRRGDGRVRWPRGKRGSIRRCLRLKSLHSSLPRLGAPTREQEPHHDKDDPHDGVTDVSRHTGDGRDYGPHEKEGDPDHHGRRDRGPSRPPLHRGEAEQPDERSDTQERDPQDHAHQDDDDGADHDEK